MPETPVSKFISAVILVLCVIAVAVNDVCLFINDSGLLGDLTIIAFVISALLFIFYCFSGYKKASANYYKAAVGSFAAAELISLINFIINSFSTADVAQRTVPIVSTGIMLLLITVLAFVKNLGKSVSVTFGYFNLLLSALLAVFCYLRDGIQYDNIYLISAVLLSALLSLMIYAKYKDKDKRGTD